jgi:predicted GNAT superfamily acetyltransferase
VVEVEVITEDAADLEPVLALNALHAVATSPLDEPALRRLLAEAFHAVRVDRGAALLIALDQDAIYDSPNFLWFRARLPRFVYVDRVIVAAAQRGRGLADALYRDLKAKARAAGHDRIVCEVNVDPPNPQSDAFHARQGFTEMGRTRLANGKTVRYLSCSLP